MQALALNRFCLSARLRIYTTSDLAPDSFQQNQMLTLFNKLRIESRRRPRAHRSSGRRRTSELMNWKVLHGAISRLCSIRLRRCSDRARLRADGAKAIHRAERHLHALTIDPTFPTPYLQVAIKGTRSIGRLDCNCRSAAVRPILSSHQLYFAPSKGELGRAKDLVKNAISAFPNRGVFVLSWKSVERGKRVCQRHRALRDRLVAAKRCRGNA